MAVLYAVAAWFVMQFADVVISLAGLPEWVGTVVLATLAIGFPIAIVLSWLYELTPGGIAREQDIPASDSTAHGKGRYVDFIIIGVLVAAVVLLVFDKLIPDQPVQGKSIAVLAFEGDEGAARESIAEGLSEEIIQRLTRVGQLKVIASTSSFLFNLRDVDVQEIGAKLGVQLVLDGSVRRSGDRIRIAAQLIDARDGSNLWSETYEHAYTAKELFQTQANVAREIANELRITLEAEDDERLEMVPTVNTEAHEAYAFGRYLLRDRHLDDLKKAADQFDLAIKLDPSYAAPYAGLADACHVYFEMSSGDVPSSCPPLERATAERTDQALDAVAYYRALEPLARKALDLDPYLGEAWVSLGAFLGHQARSTEQVEEAEDAYERGLELNPNFVQGYEWYAQLLRLWPTSSLEEYLEKCERRSWWPIIARGLEQDPMSVTLRGLAVSPFYAESVNEAIRHAHELVEKRPEALVSHETLGTTSWILDGRLDEALRSLNKAATLGWTTQLGFNLVRVNMLLGDHESVLAYIDMARRRSPAGTYESVSPFHNFSIHEALSLVSAGRLDEAESRFLAMASDENLHVALRRESVRFLIGLDLAAGGPQQAVDRIAEMEKKFGIPADASCLTRDTTEELSRHCYPDMVPLMRAAGYEGWGEKYVADTLEVLEKVPAPESEYCDLRFSVRKIQLLAIAGRNEEAIQYFTQGVADRWRGNNYRDLRKDWQWIAYYDPALYAIRSDPRFQAAVTAIEADIALRRANVQAMRTSGEIVSPDEL